MIVIYNPTAGRRRTRMLWRVLDRLVLAGARVEVAETRWAGHATELARGAAERGQALVVAAGGDGTIAEVVGGIAGYGSKLGIIPMGTANVLAHELGLTFWGCPVSVDGLSACGLGVGHGGLHVCFVGHWRTISQRRMEPHWIVPAFDVAEACHPGFSL